MSRGHFSNYQIGSKWGRWTIIDHAPKRGKRVYVLCKCECDTVKEIMLGALRSGKTKSCGCYRSEAAAKQMHTHGHGRQEDRTVTYAAWKRIKQRCYNPKNIRYERYGERGIKVCEGWSSYAKFLNDLGERPAKGMSLDRINNDGNYSCGQCKECVENGWPLNCRWATPTMQARNKKRHRMITYEGRTQCLAAWAEEANMHQSCLDSRLKKGMSMREALTKPLASRKKQSTPDLTAPMTQPELF